MTPEQRPGKRPKSTQPATPWTPPRGIRFFERPDRPSPFRVEWRGEGGTRTSAAFASAEDREVFARDLAAKRADHGRAVLQFDPREWARWLEFRAMIGAEVDPRQVAREWLAARDGAEGTPGLLVPDAIERYLAIKSRENLAADTMRHLKTHLRARLAASFAPARLEDVTADEVRAWLADLTTPRTRGPVSDVTRRHHLRTVHEFFAWCVTEGLLRRNPCAGIRPPRIAQKDVTILTPDQAENLFRANREQPCIGRLALEAFGGLRYSSAARITAAQVDLEARGLAMPGAQHKSRKRKYRQGQPDTLWLWLAVTPPACWTMTPRQYRDEKRAAFTRAGVPFPHNVLRHSFASYHLAFYKTPPTTAYLMQHTHTGTTEIYEGVAREADASAYFSIVP